MLTYEVRDAVAWATIDRPEKLNAMAVGFWQELGDAVARAASDDAVRVLVFHGAGRCFSVGGDIAGFGDLSDVARRREYLSGALGALRAVDVSPKPTIAAVHSHALGGGCELTMVCDVVVADETARFGTPEAGVGLVPGLAAARGLSQVNLHWMKYLILTGESLDAHEAKHAGLVNRVVPPGEHVREAERLAELICRQAPMAVSVAKSLLGRQTPSAYEHALDAVGLLQGTDDHTEGIAAFREARAPRFHGR